MLFPFGEKRWPNWRSGDNLRHASIATTPHTDKKKIAKEMAHAFSDLRKARRSTAASNSRRPRDRHKQRSAGSQLKPLELVDGLYKFFPKHGFLIA